MKRNLFVFMSIILSIVVFQPIKTYAETYNLGGTDMSISVDDTLWYVFTRDNIKNNPELEELGVSYDTIYNILYDNQAYMDAALYYEDGEYVELFVRKKALDSDIANLSNYKNEQVLELAKELTNKQGTGESSVYENQYKFAKLEYIDSQYGYYICEFVTVVNKDNYTITFQSTSPFTDWEYDEIENIVDSIRFDVDTSIKEKKSDSILESAIKGAVIGGVSGGIASVIYKMKKKRSKREELSSENTTKID